MEFEYVSWQNVHEICFLLFEELSSDGFHPDVIIGLARGGWPVSRILADLLNVRELKSIQIKSYEDQKRNSNLVIEDFSKNLFIRKKVLICEDIVDSGNSFKAVVARIQENVLMGGEIKTLAIFRKLESQFTPNYYLQLQNNNWIIFPWEIVETFKSLMKKMSEINAIDVMERAGVPEAFIMKLRSKK